MDGLGTVTDTYDYDAFGNLLGSTGSTANVYRYQGEALDAETGLYYLRARYYDPVAGRFLNVDPMTDQGEHPYSYAGADPVNGHDPTGNEEVLEFALLMKLFMPPAVLYVSSGCMGMKGGGSMVSFLQLIGACKIQPPPAPRAPAGPPGGSPESQCCENALKKEVKNFLQNQAGDLLKWDETMADDLNSVGKSRNVDPRLMAAIPVWESGRGKHFSGRNNPFGLRAKSGRFASFALQFDAIQEEGHTLYTHIYPWHQTTVSRLFDGVGGSTPPGKKYPWVVTPAYCSGTSAARKAGCVREGNYVADWLSGMGGDAANRLRPGNPNELGYPCTKK
jgi:RHS repeat-associated protein